ncbi:MarR family transcriptional regulator [Xanthobacter sp. DSM 24535]|uniref:MarR family winged helix-turn-helix transcriptional regulator n=1 Tax=Roseixanthobacter psychrophilus TaxID=3119917 RepID=UPI0037293745
MDQDQLKLGDFLCFAVYSTGHAFNRVYKPILDTLGITYPQYLVLVALWDRDGQTVGQIGESLFLESSTLTPLLKRLESAGHVRRERDARDERQVRIHLTEKGRALQDQAKDVPRCIFEATGKSIEDLIRLQGEIVALREALARYEGQAPKHA